MLSQNLLNAHAAIGCEIRNPCLERRHGGSNHIKGENGGFLSQVRDETRFQEIRRSVAIQIAIVKLSGMLAAGSGCAVQAPIGCNDLQATVAIKITRRDS